MLQEVCNDVVQSEKRLCQLSAEVKKLRNQVNSGRPYHSTQPLHTVQGEASHSWLRVGPTWLHVGPTWLHVGPTWLHVGPTWLLVGPTWLLVGPTRTFCTGNV